MRDLLAHACLEIFVAKRDLELILQPLPPHARRQVGTTTKFLWGAGDWIPASCMLGNRFINWATAPFLKPFKKKIIGKLVNGHTSKHLKLQDASQITTNISLHCAALASLSLIYRPDWTQSYSDSPASASQMLDLKAYTMAPSTRIIYRALNSHLSLFSWIIWSISSQPQMSDTSRSFIVWSFLSVCDAFRVNLCIQQQAWINIPSLAYGYPIF